MKPPCSHDQDGDGCLLRCCYDWPVCRTHLKWYAQQNLWAMVERRPVAEVSATLTANIVDGRDIDLWFLTPPDADEIKRYTRKRSSGRMYFGRRKNAVRSPVNRDTALVVADWYEAHGDMPSANRIRLWLGFGNQGELDLAVPMAGPSQGDLFG